MVMNVFCLHFDRPIFFVSVTHSWLSIIVSDPRLPDMLTHLQRRLCEIDFPFLVLHDPYGEIPTVRQVMKNEQPQLN